VETLANLWWIKLPRFVRRVVTTPYLALTDGLYIAAVPPVAAFLSPVIFLLGLLFGSLHFGYQHAFSESLPLLLVITLLGILSGHLGFMFLAGFIPGDILIYQLLFQSQGYQGWLLQGSFYYNAAFLFSHIIEYALLAILLVQIPLLTKALLAQFYEVLHLGKVFSLIFATLGHLLLSGLLLFYWAQIVPFLIRPVFVWNEVSTDGKIPPIGAMELLQGNANFEFALSRLFDGNAMELIRAKFIWVLVGLAVLASIVRMAAQIMVALSPSQNDRISALEGELTENETKTLTEYLPKVVLALFSGAWSALLLSGLYDHWAQGFIIGGIIFVLYLVRVGSIPLPLGAWSRWMNSVQLLVRLIAVVALVSAAYYLFVRQNIETQSFTPLFLLIIFAVVLIFLLNPGVPESENEMQPSTM
jgi:hypothetical protein